MSPFPLPPSISNTSTSSGSSQSLYSSANSGCLSHSTGESQSQPLTKSPIAEEAEGESTSGEVYQECEHSLSIHGLNPSLYISSHVWEQVYDTGLYLAQPEPSTPRREEYRQWVDDHQPFVRLPEEYHAPYPTPADYSVMDEGKPLLHYGIAFTQEEVLEYYIRAERVKREDLHPSNAVRDGFAAATALVRHFSQEARVHLDLRFPLSLKYHYVAALCDTNNMFTQQVKKGCVADLERLVEAEYGNNRRLCWWWDQEWTHPRNGHDPSWRFPRYYTGQAEGKEYGDAEVTKFQ
ncbi:hypothetical protein K466DRAFT_663405 [Polyporus arcularius HHB13444]|uniref:Uncharacterized protein n=1 Tax=Polyporus arcularius HHB13444 TaxID=1314778 RepID=A0A5C3PAZ2_9APHY|nr:hypothetical protein K466DRAFT_663405 [Polyporus arcularius HHB13444]